MPLIAAACMFATAQAASSPLFVADRTAGTDPDGQPNTAIFDLRDGTPGHLFVAPRPSQEPKENLTGFSNLSMSSDGKALYFQTHAWVTSDAVHKVDLSTRGVSFVTDGDITCVLRTGRWRGDLVVHRHSYYPQGGSHEDERLYEPSGRQVGLVREGEDSAGVCAKLEQ